MKSVKLTQVGYCKASFPAIDWNKKLTKIEPELNSCQKDLLDLKELRPAFAALCAVRSRLYSNGTPCTCTLSFPTVFCAMEVSSRANSDALNTDHQEGG